jgi:hypothetical protein
MLPMLSNGSKYKIYNVEHTIRDDLIIKTPIPMTDIKKLEKLYNVIKYTTEFLENNNIDYCISSGTLIGCVRHYGIIPWDNDVDIIIFKEGYLKIKNLMNKYNNNHYTIIHMTPGYKLFYDNECYGELFVYDNDEKLNKYRMSYPYIDNDKPTFMTSQIYYDNEQFNKDDLFPTKITLFEDFYVRVPNNITNVLLAIYKNSNLLECKYSYNKNQQYESVDYKKYSDFANVEKLLINKIFIFVYFILHWLVSKFLISI